MPVPLQPVWLWLLVPLAAGLWLRPLASRALTRLRALAIVALLGALSQPVWPLAQRRGTVVVVADRSDSMPRDASARQIETVRQLERSLPAGDRLAVVAFGRQASVEQPPQTARFAGFLRTQEPDQSNLRAGIETALGLVPRGEAGRVLVLSDGRATGSEAAEAALQAATRAIPVDYQVMARPVSGDVAIRRVQAPARLAPGESLPLTFWVDLPAPGDLAYELRRGTNLVAAGVRQGAAGTVALAFRDTLTTSGMLEYELRLPPDPADPVPENNRARCLVQIQGRRPVLCITPSGASGFANLLRRGGLDVVDRDPAAGTVDLASLAGCSAVILENTPAGALGRHGLELLAAWVRETGGGLMTTGGRHAYGPGGYYGSALESVLPVTLELRQDQRKFALALVLAMDRSGSMSAPVAGSRTKMDLANLGALQVLGLLGPFDRFGLLAVDSTAHTVVPLLPSDRARARAGDIRRIASQGGGIFIYEALSNALRMLSNDDGAAVGARHILLFADAADSEEPGEYRELLARATAAGITVSVVGLGSPADTDAGLLRDIAHRGSGQCFFTQDALDVPRLFVQDTFTVARTALVTEPTATAFTAAAQLLDADRYAPPPVIGGYNLCYLRPEALAAAVTCDESRAPVVAFWQVGAGRALAFTGAVDGELSDPLARWPHAGAFLTGLARWTAGPDEGLPGVVPLVRPIPGGLRIELHCDPDESAGASTPWRDAPRLLVLHELPGAPPRLTVHRLDWETPDLLTAEVLATGREVLLPVIQVRGQEPVTLAPFCLPYSPEHAPGPAANGSHLLAECARISGGQERNDAPTVWQSLRKSRTPVPLAPYLYLAAAGLFLLEVFERRTGRLPAGRRLQRLRRPRPLALAAGSARAATPPGELSAPQSDEAGEPAAHAALPAPPAAPATAPDPLTQARERSRNRINRRTP